MLLWQLYVTAFKYAGLEEGTACYCGDDYKKHKQAPEAECNVPCTGNASQKCGGNLRLSVYGAKEPKQHPLPKPESRLI